MTLLHSLPVMQGNIMDIGCRLRQSVWLDGGVWLVWQPRKIPRSAICTCGRHFFFSFGTRDPLQLRFSSQLHFLTFSHHNRRSTLSISSPRSPHRTSLFHYALVVKSARLIHKIVAASNKFSFGTQNFRSVLFLLLFIPHTP